MNDRPLYMIIKLPTPFSNDEARVTSPNLEGKLMFYIQMMQVELHLDILMFGKGSFFGPF